MDTQRAGESAGPEGRTAHRTRENMNAAITDFLVIDYEHLIPAIVLPDDGDRHVVAAAIRSSSDVIVTYNPATSRPTSLGGYNIKPQHPDQFIEHLLDLDEPRVITAVKGLREGLTRPPVTAEAYLTTLELPILAPDRGPTPPIRQPDLRHPAT